MSTVVPGLVKIGKTGLDNFENRMNTLEGNGYRNVVGLKRRFAILVDDYDDKEVLLGDIFSKSRVGNTELFALDVNLVIQLLSSFDGVQVFPEPERVSKEEVFDEAVIERKNTEVSVSDSNKSEIPDGVYYLSQNRKDFGLVEGTLKVLNGVLIIQKGSTCCPFRRLRTIPKVLNTAKIENNVLQEDIECNSLSTAGEILLGVPTNGWTAWKDENGVPLSEYREGWNAWNYEND